MHRLGSAEPNLLYKDKDGWVWKTARIVLGGRDPGRRKEDREFAHTANLHSPQYVAILSRQ